jgi:hypothetical protein
MLDVKRVARNETGKIIGGQNDGRRRVSKSAGQVPHRDGRVARSTPGLTPAWTRYIVTTVANIGDLKLEVVTNP